MNTFLVFKLTGKDFFLNRPPFFLFFRSFSFLFSFLLLLHLVLVLILILLLVPVDALGQTTNSFTIDEEITPQCGGANCYAGWCAE